jgi:hypothetical protein
MAKIGTATAKGISGTSYSFNVYPITESFKAIGAVYIITKRTPKPDGGGEHKFVYIGQTGDLSERFNDHHKDACFQKQGANYIWVHANQSEERRFDIETDLCRYHDAPCND